MPIITTSAKPFGVWKPTPLRTQLGLAKDPIDVGKKMTLSDIKADVGSYVGHVQPHSKMLERAEEMLSDAIKKDLIADGFVHRVGDDIHLAMTHTLGGSNSEIHGLAWNIFEECANIAKDLALYGAGQDLLVSEFSGNVQGMGPGVAEVTFNQRRTEPVLIFAADKTSPYAFNRPLFNMFTSPYNSIGLVVDPKFFEGFQFVIKHLKSGENGILLTPEERTAINAFLGSEEFAVDKILGRNPAYKDEEVAACSTSRLNFIAGKYVGKDDPAMIVRVQSGLPAVGEAVNPFNFAALVPGGMRGSCLRPLMPCSVFNCDPTQNDGPPRVIGIGTQINKGTFGDLADLLGDISFDRARKQALELASYMQQHGVFYPGVLPDADLEYGGKPDIYAKFEDRFGSAYKAYQKLADTHREQEAAFIKNIDEGK
jgi:fructose 1,6-bisphosphate aldolase/phosphatase